VVPSGAEILFVSNHGADPDRVFNYDVFALNVASGNIRRSPTRRTPISAGVVARRSDDRVPRTKSR